MFRRIIFLADKCWEIGHKPLSYVLQLQYIKWLCYIPLSKCCIKNLQTIDRYVINRASNKVKRWNGFDLTTETHHHILAVMGKVYTILLRFKMHFKSLWKSFQAYNFNDRLYTSLTWWTYKSASCYYIYYLRIQFRAKSSSLALKNMYVHLLLRQSLYQNCIYVATFPMTS